MKKLQIMTLLSPQKTSIWKDIDATWAKYFTYEQEILSPNKLREIVKSRKPIDILFLDIKNHHQFLTSYYHFFKKKSKTFKYVVVGESPSEEDVEVYKNMADDIVYLNSPTRVGEWKVLALLRRHWDSYSKRAIIIYKGIIADFIDSYVEINKNVIQLTLKELRLLRFFLNNIGNWKSRQEIFEYVWKVKDTDTTRTVDQMVFKLRKKIGDEYFRTSRNKGIKFE